MNMIDITPIINAVVALAAAGVTVFLIPWIKSKTTDEQRKELLEFLKSQGFTVDEEAINAAIEAAVNQLNGGNLPLE